MLRQTGSSRTTSGVASKQPGSLGMTFVVTDRKFTYNLCGHVETSRKFWGDLLGCIKDYSKFRGDLLGHSRAAKKNIKSWTGVGHGHE